MRNTPSPLILLLLFSLGANAKIEFTMKVLDDRGTLSIKAEFKQNLEQTISLFDWKNWVEADRMMDRFEIKNRVQTNDELKYLLVNTSSEGLIKLTGKYNCTEFFSPGQWKRICDAVTSDPGTTKYLKTATETLSCTERLALDHDPKTLCSYTSDSRLKAVSTLLVKRTEQTLALSSAFEKFSDLMVFNRSVERQELLTVAYQRFQNDERECLFHQFYKNHFDETQARRYKSEALYFKSSDLTCSQ